MRNPGRIAQLQVGRVDGHGRLALDITLSKGAAIVGPRARVGLDSVGSRRCPSSETNRDLDIHVEGLTRVLHATSGGCLRLVQTGVPVFLGGVAYLPSWGCGKLAVAAGPRDFSILANVSGLVALGQWA